MRREHLLLLAVLAASPAAAQTGGIGGTGISPQTGGIGGTGISRPILGYGPIQAFGSVFVNGREYAFGASTRVSIDGTPATIAALRVGDVAQIYGETTSAHGGYAQAIVVVHPLIGPVSQISADGHSAVILGQTVQAVGGAALFAGVAPGQSFAVSAQRDAAGIWHAGAVALAPSAHFQLLAVLTAVAPGQLQAAGVSIAASAALTAHVEPGESALITGSVKDGTPEADSLAPAPRLNAPVGTLVEAQDYFRAAGAGQLVSADGLTAQGRAVPALTGDQPVEISGVIEAGDKVDLDDVAPDLPESQETVAPAHDVPDAAPEIPELPDNEILEHGKPDD